ncbi:probable G-protein coupled receptor 139 [Narcine bancroftii]|uniref:probable G-protein coupled receptor 139 n=1 Tax=Narcine bancroftii TaxID=1343680 RepID=UPI0038316894
MESPHSILNEKVRSSGSAVQNGEGFAATAAETVSIQFGLVGVTKCGHRDRSAQVELQGMTMSRCLGRCAAHNLSGTSNVRWKLLTYPCNSNTVNFLTIVILSRGNCGLSKCITRYLVGMSMADLMSVVIGVVMEQINNIYVYSQCLLFTPICALTLVLNYAAIDCSVWFTVAFTFDRYISICSQKLRGRYCSVRTATVVIVILTTWNCVRYVPYYFVVEPYVIIKQVPWRCVPKAEYWKASFWRIYTVFNSIVTPLLPISSIVLFNALTVRQLVVANRTRRCIRKSVENQKDTEVENRRKSMLLLFALSTNFILLWIPSVVFHSKWQTQNYFYTDRYLSNPTYILQQTALILQFLSTCTNTCIYTLSQRKFREELKLALKHILTSRRHLCIQNVR